MSTASPSSPPLFPSPFSPDPERTAMTTSMHFHNLPELSAPLAGGAFAGVTTQPDGTHAAVVLLPERGANLTRPQAAAWAEELGGTLPTKPIAAMLVANVRRLLLPEWHWLQETEGASYAWVCYFYNGNQHGNRKSFEGSAVAVRCIPLIP